jgi:hypothetical protein
MEYITKCDCFVHSLKDSEGKPQLAEATIIEKTGDNIYTADYNGIRCTAIFNPFVGRFYVDDIYGVLPDDKQKAEDGRADTRQYEVTITETLKRTVSVEAKNRLEAEEIVTDDWKNGKYVLTADDFQGARFKAVRQGVKKP